MKKICIVTTSPLIVNFFLLPFLSSLGRDYRVALAVNPDEDTALAEGHGAELIALPIRRKISPWSDLRVLALMVRLFRERRFDAVHSFSPKAGLLATVAARIAGVPVRIHTYTGQVWMTRSGIMRSLLAVADRMIARSATHLLADSPSQLQVLLDFGIVENAHKCRVLGSGSVSGVDPVRFRPDGAARAAVRAELGIAANAMVFLFLGRLTREKGVLDLAQAFASLAPAYPAAVLLLVGPDEETVRPKIESICRAHAGRVRFAGHTRTPERFIAAADALCLPSYREGFGMAIIEAAAAGIPAIGSRIYGITDAIVEDETGLLHAPADAGGLAERMRALIENPALRERLGARARQRAVAEFNQQRLTRALLNFYREALGE
jgi:glycosyltransferase involved in cell wall biosynthesis